MTGRGALAGGVFAAGMLLTASPAAVRAADLTGAGVDTLTAPAEGRTFCLSRRFVFASTFVLTEEGDTLRAGADYALDADDGCVLLLNPERARAGARLIASYRFLPLRLAPSYRLEDDPTQARVAPPEAPEAPTRARAFTSESETGGLDVSGSKTFGVEVGNRRDLKLRQSLDLKLAGTLPGDVSVLALLSDQDVPFQPEGSTAELEELDKILVEVRGRGASAALGDVDVVLRGTGFADLERRLEGLVVETTAGGPRSRGALASAKGEFTSGEFFGQEGKQGPYRLSDRGGDAGIGVVAGSERVWLDGAPLLRGEEEDYVIEYAIGEITFTSRHPITANSRIVVDYEVSTARYRRRLQLAAVESLSLGGAGALRAAFVREEDDPDDPLAGELSPAERAALAALGDSATTVSGGTSYVGPGRGDYELVLDAESGREVFVFVDGAGDYRVEFVPVGDGQGDYARDEELSTEGRSVYRFVGGGRGAFIVRRDLIAPERRSVVDAAWELGGRAGVIRAEGAVSEADRNLLSGRDDGDNDGAAGTFEARANPVDLGRDWTTTPALRWRRVDANFRSPGRLRAGFYGRDWNLPGVGRLEGEDLLEAEALTAWRDRFTWRSEAGRLVAGDTLTAVRQRQTVSWRDGWIVAGGSWLAAGDDGGAGARGSLDRGAAELRIVRWAVQPRGRVLREEHRFAGAGRGERRAEWEAALGFPLPAGSLRAEVGLGRRADEARDSTGAPWLDTADIDRLFLSSEGNWRTVSMLLRYEERTRDSRTGGRQTDTLGRLDLRHNALRGAWTALLTADLGTVGLRRRPKIIEPDSTGFFDEFGNYVGPGGGYDVRFEDLGEETLTSRLDLSARTRWAPRGSEPGTAALVRRVGWEGFVTLTESSSLPLGTPRRLFSPSSYLNATSTLDGRLRLRQTLEFDPEAAVGGRLRLELSRRVIRNEETETGSLLETSGDRTWTATARGNPSSRWTLELEGTRGRRTEEVSIAMRSSFRLATDLLGATARAGRRFGDGASSGRVSVEAGYSDEDGGNRKAAGWVVRPRAQWTFARKGRLDVRYARTELVVRRGFPALRGPGAPSLVEGWRLDVVGDLRLREGVAVTATVVIDGPRGFDTVTEGRVDVRGSF